MSVEIGQPLARGGGEPRVTGEQLYVADVHLPGELHAKLVTLPVAHARIRAIDSSRALAVPGCQMVFSAADMPVPMPRFGPQFSDRPVIATGEVKYHGDPVAIVAADTKDAAEEAARLVQVDYEELPAVFTVAGALADGAPLVQDPALRPNDALAHTNVLREHRVGWGDVDGARADLVVEHTYHFPMVTQFAIEPHAFIAAPDGDGLAVWSTIQHPYWLQRVLARAVGLPLSRVRVFGPDPGGAFGGKQHAKYEPALAFMALKAGRPVRLVLSLEETFQAVRRTETEITVRTGVKRDGSFAFQDIDAAYLIGAYADIADRVTGKGSYIGNGPYIWPAARILARSVLSHTVPSTAFRGFGNPADQLGGRIEHHRRGDPAGHRPSGNPPAQPGEARATGSSPSTPPAMATGHRQSGAPRSWRSGIRPSRRATGGDRAGHQVGADDRPVAFARAPPGRRLGDRLRRHPGHGPGRAHDLRPDRGGRTACAHGAGRRR